MEKKNFELLLLVSECVGWLAGWFACWLASQLFIFIFFLAHTFICVHAIEENNAERRKKAKIMEKKQKRNYEFAKAPLLFASTRDDLCLEASKHA